MAVTPSAEARLIPLNFSDLDGWRADGHAAAFAAFRRGASVLLGHPPKARANDIDAAALAESLGQAASMPASPTDAEARAFFEAAFAPFAVEPAGGGGFFTGYYEPEVEGSFVATSRFAVPLYRAPPELTGIGPGERPAGLDATFHVARRTTTGMEELPDRAAIMAGALAGRGLELVHIADPVDAFFIHIQGAARIRLTDGGEMRITYAAKTGHPYTPIGRTLIEKGALDRADVTMQTIRAWLAAHPDQAGAVMATNRSYVFFREAAVDDPGLGPIAAAKVPLSPGRSLAIDRLQHSFHQPVWIETTLPAGARYHRLMIAQDTGSAIVGPARGDIFFGSGAAAGGIAGAMRCRGRFVVLVAKATAK